MNASTQHLTVMKIYIIVSFVVKLFFLMLNPISGIFIEKCGIMTFHPSYMCRYFGLQSEFIMPLCALWLGSRVTLAKAILLFCVDEKKILDAKKVWNMSPKKIESKYFIQREPYQCKIDWTFTTQSTVLRISWIISIFAGFKRWNSSILEIWTK